MAQLKIVLSGGIPSKKNNRRWVGRGSRKFLVPSANYEIWHSNQMRELIKYRIKSPIVKCTMTIDIAFPNNIRADLSNKAESVMDLLVDAGILKDDCHQIVSSLNLKSLGADKENPRAVIIIEYENDTSATS